MEEIRTLKSEELEESFRLSSFAFQYPLSQLEIDENIRRSKPEEIWGYFVDGKLASKARIIPFQTYIQGKLYEMGGIASVSTWPEYRRKGMVAKLLSKALEVMRSQGQSVSFLAPFAFEFYRKYGWETYIERKEYTIETALLPKLAEQVGYMRRVGQDFAVLNSIYEKYAAKFNGMLIRSETWWEKHVLQYKDGFDEAAVYFDADDHPTGYLIYHVETYEMTIREMVFLDEQARRGLWKFIGNHDSMIKQLTLLAPSTDQLPFLLENPRIKQEISPYFMARIVDVEAFLSRYTFVSNGQERRFYIRVEDQQADWNNGLFLLEIDGEGHTSVSRLPDLSESAEDNDAILRCGIGTLTTMLMGYQSPGFLHEIGRLAGEDAQVLQLERKIPKRSTYLLDFF